MNDYYRSDDAEWWARVGRGVRWLLIVAFVLGFIILAASFSFGQGFPQQCGSQSCKSVLQEERAKFGAQINQAEAGLVLDRTAWRIRTMGFGLLKKTGGNRCPVPGSTVTVSCDWLLHQPSHTGCDVLIDGPSATTTGKATPTWCAGEPYTATFVPPSDPGGVTPPEPPQPDPLESRVAVLEAKVKALEAKTVALDARATEQGKTLATLQTSLTTAQGQIQTLTDAVAALAKQVTDIACPAVDIDSSRAWGHSHTVRACPGK